MALWGALGAVVGLPLFALAVLRGVVAVDGAVLGPLPWWSPLLSAAAGAVCMGVHAGIVRPLTRGFFGAALPAATSGGAGFALLQFAAVAAGCMLLGTPRQAVSVAVVLLVASLALTARGARAALVLQMLGVALLGTAAALGALALGAEVYAKDALWGVPLWVPAVAAHAGVASHVVDRWLVTEIG